MILAWLGVSSFVVVGLALIIWAKPLSIRYNSWTTGIRERHPKFNAPPTPEMRVKNTKIMTFLFRFVGVLLASLALANSGACNTESRHRIIVYDQPWSSAASAKNRWCSTEVLASCFQEGKSEELDFTKRLATAFSITPECATVQFLILSGNDKNSNELEGKLEKNVGSEYWRLRVDFHPELSGQPFDLRMGNSSNGGIGGDDAEHSTAFMCKAAKNNGVIDVW